MQAIHQLSQHVPLSQACACLAVPRADFYRRKARAARPAQDSGARRPPPPMKLSVEERRKVLDILHDPAHVDDAPRTIHARLLDQGTYLASPSTFYRILVAEDELRERRNQRRHPKHAKPELLATGPNQLWSWDITKLKGPQKWTYFYLYVIIDVFSRYVVGWTVETRESAAIAKTLIKDSCAKQNIREGVLTLHADRGSSMTSKPVAQLLADLGVTKTHNRPYVSNDNPFSEAQFKTLKYHPAFPGNFGCLQDARAHCRAFFAWYNNEHLHVGIAFMTPADVHHERAAQVADIRQKTLDAAFRKNPGRFKNKPPKTKAPPSAVWINPPKLQSENQNMNNMTPSGA